MSWIRPMQCTECRIKDEQLAARNAMVEAKVVLIKQLREDNDTLAETLRLDREKTKTGYRSAFQRSWTICGLRSPCMFFITIFAGFTAACG